jgi:hypothetical protein
MFPPRTPFFSRADLGASAEELNRGNLPVPPCPLHWVAAHTATPIRLDSRSAQSRRLSSAER